MGKILTHLNTIPVRTWSWLGVNESHLEEEFPEIRPYSLSPTTEVHQNSLTVASLNQNILKANPVDHTAALGINPTLTDLCVNQYNTGYLIEAGGRDPETPVVLNFLVDRDNPVAVAHNLILAHENSSITVVMIYRSGYDARMAHNGLTRLVAKKGATINLVMVQVMSDDALNFNAITAEAETNATVNTILVELGSRRTLSNCRVRLKGKNSNAAISAIYLGDRRRTIDLNYLITHQGQASRSEIEARGALMDESQKIFRGTLDFQKGASGAVGKEEEYAILLSPKVRNRSVPLLLCAEDDVEGQHAASTGKIDENKLFYLMSRGLSELEAKKLMVEATFNPVIQKLPLPELRLEIDEFIQRRLIHVS